MVPFGGGATRTAFVDPLTLPCTVSRANGTAFAGSTPQHDDNVEAERQPKEAPPKRGGPREPPILVRAQQRNAEEHKGSMCPADREVFLARLGLLRPLLTAPRHLRADMIRGISESEGVSVGTVYRWLRQLRKGGASAFSRQPRADAGRPRIPREAYDLIVSGLVSNPPSTSAASVHRTLLRAAPDALTYERAGRRVSVSLATVTRIRNQLRADPRTRGLFFDADEWEEFQRVYSGEVVSAHANDLWQMDMTRCDVMVVEPDSGDFFRPRIHAIIDVYSGCIPGLALSREEDQTQTDLALLRALLPKGGAFADKYPIYGVPRRMYWDNGKTYRSRQAERIMSELGVEVRNSIPRVRHTRGSIERFFRSLHGFERSLPGYLGVNAAERASGDVRQLERETKRWLASGRDPGPERRLLTASEYQASVLAWLVAEYHPHTVHGKSRLAHFVETAPPASRALLDQADLVLLFAARVERVVEPNGNVRVDNRRWTIPDGSLMRFVGRRVLVLHDQFALPGDRRLIAWRDRHGRLDVIGEAMPAPTVADSVAAGEDRRRKRAVAAQLRREALRLKHELTDPSLRVVSQLVREAEVVLEPLEPASMRGRVAAIRPADPRERLTPDDPLARFLLDGSTRAEGAPEDPAARAAWFERLDRAGDER